MREKNVFWKRFQRHYQRHPLGVFSFFLILLFCFMAIYAPFLASSKPIFVIFDDQFYFPLFRYLFFPGFFTKALDRFFNLLMFTFPLFFVCLWIFRNNYKAQWGATCFLFFLQICGFLFVYFYPPKDPAVDINARQKLETIPLKTSMWSWKEEAKQLNSYAKLNLLIKYILQQEQNKKLSIYSKEFAKLNNGRAIPTLWELNKKNQEQEIKRLVNIISTGNDSAKREAEDRLQYIQDRSLWLETESKKVRSLFMPLIRPFHWEDDAGGEQSLNRIISWWDLTRINRKDLVAALIFGARISLVVGFVSVAISLLIGIPIGAFAGYFGGKFDIITYRLIEIWESMPVFFMLLMIVAILQSKSIFLVITVIGIFSWTSFSRYIRGEVFKQRNLPYVEACHAQGFGNGYIIFSHILPNAIPPLLTLLPFAIMGAITSEAGLSFLGLGEEGSCSWGVLMDEGRTAFPAESYLLWPPAILLTILLISIALVGDALRDALDPKLA